MDWEKRWQMNEERGTVCRPRFEERFALSQPLQSRCLPLKIVILRHIVPHIIVEEDSKKFV
jgi:hypothetical protein